MDNVQIYVTCTGIKIENRNASSVETLNRMDKYGTKTSEKIFLLQAQSAILVHLEICGYVKKKKEEICRYLRSRLYMEDNLIYIGPKPSKFKVGYYE